jgi:flagellar biogenesis protein FliO
MNSVFVYATAALAAAATLYGAARFFWRRSALEEIRTADDEPCLEILSTTPVGFGRSLVLVRFEGRRILLGVTRGQWTALADLGRTVSQDSGSVIETELNRALQSDRFRRGRKNS